MKYSLAITIYFLSLINLFSQSNNIEFEHISIDNGLSQSSVFSIIQDRKGFIWIGTLDGLNKYDGYNFKIYRSLPNDTTSLSHNTVFTIFEDSQGSLWIGTLGGGLNKYIPEIDGFIHYEKDEFENSLSNNNIRAIFEDDKNNLWIGTDNGLNLYDKKNNSFIKFFNSKTDENSLSNNNVWSITQDKDGYLWIGTYAGLNKYDLTKNKFSHFVHEPSNQNSLSNNYVWDIKNYLDDYLLIATNFGLGVFNRKTEKFINFFSIDKNQNTLSHNNVWDIFVDNKNDIWAATLGGGISKISNVEFKAELKTNTKFTRYRNNKREPKSLSHDLVWSIFQDKSGIIWIGTDLGLNKINTNSKGFQHFYSHPYEENSISSNEITSIIEDNENNLWIGTRNGLNYFEPTKNKFTKYLAESPNNSITNNYVRSLFKDNNGIIWIGTNGGGLNKFNPKTRKFESFEVGFKPNSISNNNVSTVYEDSQNNMWIGTLAGLNLLDKSHGTFKNFISDRKDSSTISHDYISAIFEDSRNNLWIGTLGGGINRLDRQNYTFERFEFNPNDKNSIINNYVWSIYEDDQNRLWIGTNNGLEKYDYTTNKFNHTNTNSNFSYDAVYGILQDNSGFMWISTNRGLIKFLPNSDFVRVYDFGDGLQSNQFSGGAAYKTENGKIYFGGINGFNSFFPDSIKDNKYIPNIVISKFEVFNNSLKNTERTEINHSLFSSSSINLDYRSNSFLIEFAALDFTLPSKNQYAYRMDGIDNDWILSGTRKFVTYTNLDPGSYTFHVKGSNNDGIWNNEGTSLSIIITPPFWMTWWFILIIITTIFVVISLIIYSQISHLLEMERLRVKIAADLHDDIGTRLTEISMLTDVLYHKKSSCDDPDKETVRKVGGIARALIDNMSDIVWLINPKRDTLYELFMKLRDTYEEILSYSNIYLQINNFNFLEKIRLPMEYRKNLYLIFKESMNNSLKHSSCTEISINANLKGKTLEITLYDNGQGFDITEDSKGNGLTNMKARAESIGGSLRIQSSLESGTMIKFVGKIQ